MTLGYMELAVVGGVGLLTAAVYLLLSVTLRAPDGRSPSWIGTIYGVPLCFAVAAVLTPPDVVSLVMLAAPASVLFGAVAAVTIVRRRPTTAPQAPGPGEPSGNGVLPRRP